MNSLPLASIAARVLSISSSTRSYISAFGTCLPIGALSPSPSEIAGERLFADDVFAGLHRVDDHRGVQIGRRADVDDIELAVGDQVAKAAVRRRDLVPAGKIDDMVAPRRDGGFDFDIHAVDAPVGIACAAPKRSRSRRDRLLFLSLRVFSINEWLPVGAGGFCRQHAMSAALAVAFTRGGGIQYACGSAGSQSRDDPWNTGSPGQAGR